MAKFIIEGKSKLKGVIKTQGNKNEVLPAIAASLLTTDDITIQNVPRIKDVEVMLDIFRDLGGEAQFSNFNTLQISAKNIKKFAVNPKLAGQIRASFLFAGPLLARFGKAHLYPPGGDIIGKRGLHCHFQGFDALGAHFKLNSSYNVSVKRKLVGSNIFLDEPSVMGTENIIMASILASGTTVLENAAMEPHVTNLCRMLNKMGAKIGGIGTPILTIKGVTKLHGCEHKIAPDHIETGSLITLALVTGSEIEIVDSSFNEHHMLGRIFSKFNAKIITKKNSIIIPANQSLKILPDYHNSITTISDGPWPQFPTDLMSNIIVLATKAKGTVLIFEKMFDRRVFFVDTLISAGAKIIVCDPYRVVVSGPSKYYGFKANCPDIRAGISLLIAALSAKGASTLYNIAQIERGYERIDERLNELGAKIKRTS